MQPIRIVYEKSDRPIESPDVDRSTFQHQTINDIILQLNQHIQQVLSLSATTSSNSVPTINLHDLSAKQICASLDYLFACGLNTKYGSSYWAAIISFESKSHREYLQQRWNPQNGRDWSLAWLCESLNDGSLPFQLLALTNHQSVLRQFYNPPHTLMLDIKQLQRVADLLGYLYRCVQINFSPFALYDKNYEKIKLANNRTPTKTSARQRRLSELTTTSSESSLIFQTQHNQEFKSVSLPIEKCIDATVYRFPLVSDNATARKQRKIRKLRRRDKIAERNSLTNSASIIEEFHYSGDFLKEEDIAPLIDEDTMFSNIVDSINFDENSDNECKSQNVSHMKSNIGIDDKIDNNNHVEIKKSASSIIPQRVKEENNSYEAQLQKHYEHISSKLQDEKKLNSIQSSEDTKSDVKKKLCHKYVGELHFDSGNKILLAMQIFQDDGETFYQAYRIYHEHAAGVKAQRQLILTNSRLYAVHKSEDQFFVHYDSRYLDIDYVTIGLAHQSLAIHTKNDNTRWEIVTASENITRSILSAIESIMKEQHILVPGFLLDDAAPMIVVKKWAANELNMEIADIEVLHYVLCYWKVLEAPRAKVKGTEQRSAYLYIRRVYANAWFNKFSQWQRVYVVLADDRIYVFTDSTCKIGESIIHLRDEVESCAIVNMDTEHAYAFELTLHRSLDANVATSIQFGAQTLNDVHQWTLALTHVLAMGINVATDDNECPENACFLTIINTGHLLIGQQSTHGTFIRTLAPPINLKNRRQMKNIQAVKANSAGLLLTVNLSPPSTERWWLTVRNVGELKKLTNTIEFKMMVNIESVPDQSGLDKSNDHDDIIATINRIDDYWRDCAQQ